MNTKQTKNRCVGWIFLLLVLPSMLLVSCSSQQTGKQEAEPIKIGSILILTGEGSSWGNAARRGIDLAVEDINAKGGVLGRKLIVNHQDDASDSKKALSAFQQLTDVSGVNIVIGTTWSHTGLPLVKLADEKKVLMISPSLGVKEFNEGSKYLFNTWPHDEILSSNLADYLFKQGHRKVGLISTQNVWVQAQTNAFKKRFAELGGSIEVLVEPQPTDTDVYSDALKLNVNQDITAIVSTTDGVLVGTRVAKQLRNLGSALPMYSISIDGATIAAAEGAYEGLQFLTFLTPTPEFEQRYKERFGEDIEIGADSAYDAVMLLAKAMQATKGTNPEELQAYLHNITGYTGESGNLVADGKGAFTKPFAVKQIKNGLQQPVSS